MANKVRVKSSVKAKVKKTSSNPVKAGAAHKGNTGGIFNAKVVAIVKKK